MAKNKAKHDYYSTYSKVLINDWLELRKCLAEHTAALEKGKHNVDPTELQLITDKELNDAFNGPYSPVFKEFIEAYLTIKRAAFAKRSSTEAVFTDVKKNLPDNPCNMQDRTADGKLNYKEPPQELIDNITEADLEKRLEQLDALFRKCFTTFTKLHQAAYNESSKIFGNIGLALSEQETRFLRSDEPLTEIQRRFVDIKLEIPKIKDHGLFFSHYLQLKLLLCIQATLSMQQQQHTDKIIKTKLKEFKNIVNTCEKHEKQMITTQHKNITKIIQSLDY